MEASNNENPVSSIRYESEGLPQKEDISAPWILEKLDPHAILSRWWEKSKHHYVENNPHRTLDAAFIKNTQRHEQDRGRKIAEIYEDLLNDHGLSLKGSKVLEVGAGPGAVCLAFQEMGANVVSLDLKDGRVFYSKEVPFILASANGLPFADNSFDIISLTSVLHHIPENLRDRVIEEAFRVAKTALIQEDCLTSPMTNKLMKVVDDAVSGEINTHQADSHMSKDGWLKYFENKGLNVLESTDIHPKWLGLSIQKTFFVVSKEKL